MARLKILSLVVIILMTHFAKSENEDLDLVLNRFNNMEVEIARLTQRVNDLEMKDVSQTKQIRQLEKELILLTRQNSDLQLQHEESRETIRHLETNIKQYVRKSDMGDINQNGLNRNSSVPYHDTQYEGMDSSVVGQPLGAKGRGQAIQTGEPNLDTPLTQKPKNGRSITDPELQIAFNAFIAPNEYGPMGAGQIILFGEVLTNVGNAYHAYSGIFTAPVDGVYVFSVTFTNSKRTQPKAYFHVSVNGKDVGVLEADVGQVTEMIILNLHQNDEVYAYNGYAGDVLRGNTFFSSFSGFLLYH